MTNGFESVSSMDQQFANLFQEPAFTIDENDRDPTKTQHIVTHTRDDIRYLLVLLLEHRLEIYVQLDQVLGKPADEYPDVCRNFD